MNHAAVMSIPCESCHNGTMYASQGKVGALGVPTNHIPYKTKLANGASMTCNICHTTTVYLTLTNWNTLSSSTILHNGSLGNGNGWCIGCHLTGMNYLTPQIEKWRSITARLPPHQPTVLNLVATDRWGILEDRGLTGIDK